MANKKTGRHVQLWLPPELGERMDAVLARIPYEITISSIGERGISLALDELEQLLTKHRSVSDYLKEQK